MSLRLGLAVSHDAVRAVAIRGTELNWSAEAPRGQGVELMETISAVLSKAPTRRLDRSVVFAAIGPHASQVKLLNGLPDVSDPEILGAIVRESAGSFFLKSQSALLTTGVRSIGSQSALAGALEQDTVAAIRHACQAVRLRLRHITPTAVALPLALDGDPIVWHDGAIVIEIGRAERRIEAIRARPCDVANRPAVHGTPVPGLAVLGEDAIRFADAYGAALLDATEPLAVDPAIEGPWIAADRQRRTLVMATIAGTGVLCLILSPLAATWSRYRAESVSALVSAEQWQRIGASLDQLDRVTTALEELRAFSSSRIGSTELLAALSTALPKGHVLLDLDLSGHQVQMIALTSDPSALLAAVRTVPALRSPSFLGAVSQQRLGSLDLQRVAIRAEVVDQGAASTRNGTK